MPETTPDLAALERASRPKREVRPPHPAWELYHAAEQRWRQHNDLAARAHREMQDFADELVAAGEMQRDKY